MTSTNVTRGCMTRLLIARIPPDQDVGEAGAVMGTGQALRVG
jgi:hypothetical protein